MFLKGESAMTISWPPYGRFAAGYLANEKKLDWVPKSTIAGKVGYALPPGGHPELAAGFALSVASTSKQKEQAYLFIQWLNSEDISNPARPAALRAARSVPRFALREQGLPRQMAGREVSTWRRSRTRRKTGLLDLSLIQTDKYEEALRQGIGRLWAGDDPKNILDDVAKQWDEITQQVGVDNQKAVYTAWAAKSGAYPAAAAPAKKKKKKKA